MGRTLAQKLGFKLGMTARLDGAPPHLLPELPAGADEALPDLLLFFVENTAAVPAAAENADASYRDGACLCFAYPKKTGAIVTDISRDVGWQPLLARQFLPVAQVALDATWSALRFRRRREITKLTRQSERRAEE